jgi:hypothetical protein
MSEVLPNIFIRSEYTYEILGIESDKSMAKNMEKE